MTMQAAKIDFDKETGIGPTDPEGEFDPGERRLMEDVQGNILKSHGRGHSRHLFVRFDGKNPQKARAWVAAMADEVTSAMKQWDEAQKRREIYAAAGFGPAGASARVRSGDGQRAGRGGRVGSLGGSVSAGLGDGGGPFDASADGDGVRTGGDGDRRRHDPEAQLSRDLAENPSDPFVCMMISASGYRALGVAELPPDEAFRRGSRSEETIRKLSDPPVKQWHGGFKEQLDALVIVADDSPEDVQDKADQIRSRLIASGAGQIVHEEIGKVLRLRPDGPAREHFGFADGVSEPLFLAKDIEKAEKRDGDRKWHPGAPLKLVLAKDPGGHEETGYGSYFVYRKLEQDVPHFNRQRLKLARALAEADGRGEPHEGDKELAGAYMVGRFRNGMPVSESADDGGVDAPILNDFDFSDDKDGMRCPHQAHIRKTNPRGDTVWRFGSTLQEERTRRITRRGIPYESGGTVGLLFLCAQADIGRQFEFMQKDWCNAVDFVSGGSDGKPPTGQDPVVGLGSADTPMRWPKKHGVPDEEITVNLAESVTTRGAEYFFVPSRSSLKSLRG